MIIASQLNAAVKCQETPAMIDPHELKAKLKANGFDEVKKKRAMDAYSATKVPIVDEFLEEEEAARNAPTYMYHECDAPEGKIFPASQVPSL